MHSNSQKDKFNKRQGETIAAGIANGIAKAIAFIVLALVLGFLLAFVIKYLWNVTVVEIFGLPMISYWQAFGLFILAKLFFGLGSGGKHDDKHGKLDELCAGTATEDVSKLAGDETFQAYWEKEGKNAYEAYLINHLEQQRNEGATERSEPER